MDIIINNEEELSWDGHILYEMTAHHNGELVGYVDYFTSGNKIKIKFIHVEKPYRRMGIATAMVNEIEELFPEYTITPEHLSEKGKYLFMSLGYDIIE